MKKITIYTDGGSRGNPGKAAIGVVFYNEREQIIKKFGEYLGDNLTNNDAEYQAIIFALKKFKTIFGRAISEQSDVLIKADSEFAIKQLNGEYRLTDPKIQQFFIEIWNLKLDFKSVKFKHISREKNIEADKLVNEVLDTETGAKILL